MYKPNYSEWGLLCVDIYTQEIPSLLVTAWVVSWLLELSHNYRWVSIVDLIIDTNKNTLCVFWKHVLVLHQNVKEIILLPVPCTMKVDILRYFINVAVTLKY